MLFLLCHSLTVQCPPWMMLNCSCNKGCCRRCRCCCRCRCGCRCRCRCCCRCCFKEGYHTILVADHHYFGGKTLMIQPEVSRLPSDE